MAGFQFQAIKELSRQLIYFAKPLRLKALKKAERFIDEINPVREYPYEYIAYRITSIRPSEHIGESFSGQRLLPDLVQLVSNLSGSLNLSAADIEEPFLRVEELLERFQVSRRTLSRWKRYGLRCRRVKLNGKHQSIIFLESAVRNFEARHADMIGRASGFCHLKEEEREAILKKARWLRNKKGMSISQISRLLAREFNRSEETVRYTVRQHDRQSPSEAIFPAPASHRAEKEKAILSSSEKGLSAAEIASRFHLHRATVYRALLRKRAEEILNRRTEYIFNPIFEHPQADWLILEGGIETLAPAKRQEIEGLRIRDEESKPPEQGLLSHSEEIDLFRRFNYYKFQISRLKAKLAHHPTKASLIRRIEALDRKVIAIKQALASANLRLVTSIAKRHACPGVSFEELLSDGHLSLLKAIEKFDYSRGVRFSTYASWALVKNYAKSIPQNFTQRGRFITGQEEMIRSIPERPLPPGQEPESLAAIRATITRILRKLSPRERTVISCRFGLSESESPKTLEEIGNRFGVTRERIRQIESRALLKLRELLASEFSEAFQP